MELLNYNFSLFAQTLAPYYKGDMTIPDFTKELLLQITNYPDAVLKYSRNKKTSFRSEKTFISFYNGDRPITPIAKQLCIIDSRITRDKFIHFLKRKEFHYSDKKTLCDEFKKLFPSREINDNNLFEQISDIYVAIINESLNKTGSKNKTDPIITVHIKDIPHVDYTGAKVTSVTKKYFSDINAIIEKLIVIGRKISRFQSKKRWDLKVPEDLQKQLSSEYNRLQELYDSINNYNKKEDKLLEKALSLISQITEASFIESEKDFVLTSINNAPIHDLLSLIKPFCFNVE